MQYREFQPEGPSAAFVERYWLMECGPADAGVQRVVPDGTPELILNLDEPLESFQDGEWRRQPRVFLAGQITGPLLLRQSRAARMMGVRFAPPAAGRLLGSAMHQTANRAVPLADLSSLLVRALDAACDTESDDRRVARVAATLAAHDDRYRRNDPVVEEAVRRIVSAQVPPDMCRLARSLGISLRQLQRRFASVVGLGPKHFARIRRFQRIFPLVEQAGAGWAAAALECGYYDQAHLIRDFREFAGEAPAALLQAGDLARQFLPRDVAFLQDGTDSAR